MKSRMFLVLFVLYLFGNCVAMLATSFFKPCDPGRGTSLDCIFLTGQVAHISGPGSIEIFAHEPFTIGYYVDGNMQTETSIPNMGWSVIDFSTSGPIDVYMLKSHAGSNFPIISVSQPDPGIDTWLKVERTWSRPLTQLFQWHLISIFLIALFLGIFIIVYSIYMKIW